MADRGTLRVARWVAGGAVAALAIVAYLLLSAGAASADEPTTGTITIVLDASPNDAQDFAFTGCQGTGCGPFTLDDDADATRANSVTATDLAPATYTITQTAVANWALSSLTCDTGETISLANRRATIDLTAGEHVTCTFTNTSASITIRQSSNPADVHDFSYTGCQGAGCATFTLDDDATATLPSQTGAAGLAPGTYVITQAADATWALTAITCTTGESTNLFYRRVTITLAAGEQTTCTFHDRAPSLTVVQESTPDDPQDFTYTGCLGSGCGTFTLDDDSDPAHPKSITAVPVTTGTYTITQGVAPAAWTLLDISCTRGGTMSVTNRRATFNLTAGAQVVCTFTNSAAAITVIQDAAPDDGQDFAFTGCLEGDCSSFTLDDDADPAHTNRTTFDFLAPGTYTFTQDLGPEVWPLRSLACDDGSSGATSTRRATIALAAGERVTCTFRNDYDTTAATLTIVEDTTPDGPQDVTVHRCTSGGDGCTDVVLDDDARPDRANSSGPASLPPGTYAIDVDPVDGYELAGISCGAFDEDARGTSVRLAPGTSTTCTITHRRPQVPLTQVAQVVNNLNGGCARLLDGQARCWGGNASIGRLGDGSSSDSWAPVVVLNPDGSAPLRDVTDISAGSRLSCAVVTGGEVRCWGTATGGALGNGATTGIAQRPVVVTNAAGSGPLTGVTDVEAMSAGACAVLDTTQVRCWGSNSEGQLGDGTTTDRSRPVPVSDPSGTGALTGVVQLSGNLTSMCARLDTGEAWCWGANKYGTLGDGTATNRNLPVPVSNDSGTGPLTGIADLAAGTSATCALLQTGEARCWGYNATGGLGDGTTKSRYRPVIVVDEDGTGPLTAIAQMSAGRTGCALRTDGSTWCWGEVAGDGSTSIRLHPVEVLDRAGTAPLVGVRALTGGSQSTCALGDDTEVRCWGLNGGRQGDGTTSARYRPYPIIDPTALLRPLEDITQFDTGTAHSCARLASGEARCWGTGLSIGNPDAVTTNTAIPVRNEDDTGPLTGVVQVSTGPASTCALLSSTQVRCWGPTNSSGQLGDGTTTPRSLPVVVLDETGNAPLTGVTQVAAGDNQTCALLSIGEARCWGANTGGQLGDGTKTRRLLPVAVTNEAGTGPLTGITQLSASAFGTCAVLDSREARCWGNGSARPTVVSNPEGTGPLTGVAQISMGRDAACAVLTTGQARCWGEGTLGDGSSTASTRPVVVSNPEGTGPLTDVTSLDVSTSQTCAALVSGAVACWGGSNWSGNLGVPPPAAPIRPVFVLDPAGGGPLAGATQTSAGSSFGCALVQGRVRCWGANHAGSLGNGTDADGPYQPQTVVEQIGR